MKPIVHIAILAIALASAADAADELISGKVHTLKSGKIVKFVSKSKQQPGEVPFALPAAGSATDPTTNGAIVTFADLGLVGGSVQYLLDASGWSALGNPPGSKGYKYKGKDDVVDPRPKGTCTVVLLKQKVIKAVCKGTPVTLTTPFDGESAIEIALPAAGSDDRYCAEFGGETKKNSSKLLKRKNAPPPSGCNANGPPPTPTPTATDTPMPTATPTNTPPTYCTLGETYLGNCWFKGAINESCTATCANVGWDYGDATRFVAGSEGTDINCGAVAALFGDTGGSQVFPGAGTEGLGCYEDQTLGIARRLVHPTTDADADSAGIIGTPPDFRRYCSCEPFPKPCAAGGFSFANICWYRGSFGESCDTVCAAVSPPYSEATNLVAGADGTPDNCEFIGNIFGASFSSSTVATWGGAGCYQRGILSLQSFRDTAPTVSSASNATVQRYCACDYW